jgi:hypothetical protein
MTSIDEFLRLVPPSLSGHSGRVFYTGSGALRTPSPIYLLGFNPGGAPDDPNHGTIADDLEQARSRPDDWSAYIDESWVGAQPGSSTLQRRVRHLFDGLRIDLRRVPASNLVFARARSASDLGDERARLMDRCWALHRSLITRLEVRVVLCLGSETGRFVRDRLGADREIGQFIENNQRRWASTAHRDPHGRVVATLTHPSRVDWTSKASDPTAFVRSMLPTSADS